VPLHAAHVVVIDVFLVGEGDLRRLVVRALAEADARGNLQQLPHVAVGAPQVRLDDDADVVEAELRAQAAEDVERDLGHARVFHVHADEVAAARGLFDDGARVAVGQLRVDVEAELRELDRDVRVDARLVDARENLQVLAHLLLGLGDARHRLVEVVERGRAAGGVEPADGGDGLLDVLARDEARRHLLEGAEARDEVLQALVARKVEQCVSRDHGRCVDSAGG
jgi:hypothetical protein